ncbi:hypothetical protein [Actinomadura opuntiae]|uniref:hypothetical protein n=1 Tax=Actinomadura sp. OS1-43 TaxID=604315 RepID=UPI00255B12E1|nr:hypothetical protein [Actinomadura sp. OS1-43]MDL4812789.1 hypothetical protein [Actinomadura sp. OS1-43]
MPDVSPYMTDIDGVPHISRAGLCELTGLSLESVNHLCAPSRRPSSGCPEPVRVGRSDWFPLERALLWAAAVRRPEPQPPAPVDDPDELITVTQFRTEVMRPPVTDSTFRGYIRMSRADWDAGRDGYLPLPDGWEPARRGTSPRWRRGAAAVWQAARPGRPMTGRPREVDRVPQPAPPVSDPDELIGETRFRTQIMRPPMSRGAFKRLVAESRQAWAAGRDGVLPRPDVEERGAGPVFQWLAGRAAAWQNDRAREAAKNPPGTR